MLVCLLACVYMLFYREKPVTMKIDDIQPVACGTRNLSTFTLVARNGQAQARIHTPTFGNGNHIPS